MAEHPAVNSVHEVGSLVDETGIPVAIKSMLVKSHKDISVAEYLPIRALLITAFVFPESRPQVKMKQS